MSKPIVFVIGASGNIGSATVIALAAKYADEIEIRAGVRNPDKADKLKAIAGITVVKAEMGTKDQLVKTFKGVNSLFIVTPPTQNRVEQTTTTAEAAKESGVKAIIVLSGNVINLPETTFAKHFIAIEGNISKLGVPYTFFRLPYFVENYWSFKDSISGQGTILQPLDPTKRFPVIVVEDAGKAAAVILVDPSKHSNKTYEIVSDQHTFEEVAEGFSKALGKEVRYVRVPYEAMKHGALEMGVEEWLIDGLFDLFKAVDNGSLPSTRTSDYSQITGEQPTNLEAWLMKYSGGFQ